MRLELSLLWFSTTIRGFQGSQSHPPAPKSMTSSRLGCLAQLPRARRHRLSSINRPRKNSSQPSHVGMDRDLQVSSLLFQKLLSWILVLQYLTLKTQNWKCQSPRYVCSPGQNLAQPIHLLKAAGCTIRLKEGFQKTVESSAEPLTKSFSNWCTFVRPTTVDIYYTHLGS